MLEKNLESPLNCKEIKPVHPKGNQSWIFTGRTDAKAEAPMLWPLYVKNWLIGKDPDAGKDWRQEEKGTAEDELIRWHHWLNGHEFEQALGVGEGQGSLGCCSPWGHKESDMTERLNWWAGRASQEALIVKKLPGNVGERREAGWILAWKDPLEEGMATHSGILARRIPRMGKTGSLQSIESHRVGHDWSKLSTHTGTHWLLGKGASEC